MRIMIPTWNTQKRGEIVGWRWGCAYNEWMRDLSRNYRLDFVCAMLRKAQIELEINLSVTRNNMIVYT